MSEYSTITHTADFIRRLCAGGAQASILVVANELVDYLCAHKGPLTFLGDRVKHEAVQAPDFLHFKVDAYDDEKLKGVLRKLRHLRQIYDVVIFHRGHDLYILLDQLELLDGICHGETILLVHDVCPSRPDDAQPKSPHPVREDKLWMLEYILRKADDRSIVASLPLRPTGLLVAHRYDVPSRPLIRRLFATLQRDLSQSEFCGLEDRWSATLVLQHCLLALERASLRTVRPLLLSGSSSETGRLIERKTEWIRPPAEFIVGSTRLEMTSYPTRSDLRSIHSVEIVNVKKVTLFGSHHFHAMIDEGGALHCPEESVVPRLDFHIRHPPGVRDRIPVIKAGNEGRYTYDMCRVDRDIVEHIKEPVFWSSPIEPGNWGMWVLGIPNISRYVREFGSRKFFSFVSAEWQSSLLNYMGVLNDRVVVQEPWRCYECDDVVFTRHSRIDLTVSAWERSEFQRLSHDALSRSRETYPTRIFISRRTLSKRGSYRSLINEDELIEAMAEKGFAIVEPERHSLEEQIRIFASADVIVGLGGAGMFNVAFSKPGSFVVSIDANTIFLDGHANLFASLGHRYAFVVGEGHGETGKLEAHQPWNVNVRHVMDLLAVRL
jgi:hypothetical protein